MLREFFTETEDGWRNKRCDREIAEFQAKRDKTRRSAEARWAKERTGQSGPDADMRTHSDRSANASESHDGRNANQEPITNNQEPQVSKGKSGRAVARVPLRPESVTEQTWTDWLLLRKAKHAPVTETVVEKARREAEKAGMTLEQFLVTWCARGSQGLEAAWLKPGERPPNRSRLSAAADFRETKYAGTPDDQLPDFLRPRPV